MLASPVSVLYHVYCSYTRKGIILCLQINYWQNWWLELCQQLITFLYQPPSRCQDHKLHPYYVAAIESNHLLLIGQKTSQSIRFFLHDRTVGLSLNLCICFKEEVLKWLGMWISDNFLRFSNCIFQNLIFILDPMLSPYWWREWLSWTNKRKRKIYFINILLVPS